MSLSGVSQEVLGQPDESSIVSGGQEVEDEIPTINVTEPMTEEFNICFAPPSSDTCTTCDALNVAIKNDAMNPEKVAEHQRKLETHKAEANEAQRLMKSWKNNADADVRAVAVDLQQTLPTPRLSAGITYYKRKTWTYNLCIFNLKTEKSTMDDWVEVFIKYNTPLPSSAAVERLFSSGGDILRSKRASLTAANFESLVFLKGNLGLLSLPKGPA
ncbi:hypothetical protein GWK47_002595 [Chionoecetes opilio]|uniref:HAT C-terminal dimerisation domain-containing protein n=1 Tax=Chionoecetes opilio TaxID=41210 RepID=A0A8J4XPA2_CHIOP|nr:hypothetical protein GWK47_002595 [Chionoecetes opilio]